MKVINVNKTARKLHSAVIHSDYSIKQLANKMHITYAAMYKWFRGTSVPSLDSIVNLAAILDCKVDDLIVSEEVPDYEGLDR